MTCSLGRRMLGLSLLSLAVMCVGVAPCRAGGPRFVGFDPVPASAPPQLNFDGFEEPPVIRSMAPLQWAGEGFEGKPTVTMFSIDGCGPCVSRTQEYDREKPTLPFVMAVVKDEKGEHDVGYPSFLVHGHLVRASSMKDLATVVEGGPSVAAQREREARDVSAAFKAIGANNRTWSHPGEQLRSHLTARHFVPSWVLQAYSDADLEKLHGYLHDHPGEVLFRR